MIEMFKIKLCNYITSPLSGRMRGAFLSSLLLGVTLLSSCSTEKRGEKSAVKIPVVKISVAEVTQQNMSDTIWFYGDVQLRRDARLASQFDGRLSGFTLLMGDRVRKGEKLGVITPPMREALLQVMDQIDESKRKMVSDEIKEVPLYSPIDGVVLEVNRHTGDVVQRGESIVHIGQLNVLDVYGNIPLKYLSEVNSRKSLSVSFVDYKHDPITLKIEAVGGKMDMGKNTVPIRLRLNNSRGEYKPGMIVKLNFPGRVQEDAVVIPRSALLNEEGIFSVFVLKDGNIVEKREIKTGILHDDFVEVLEGLNIGEKVALEKAYSLIDGMEVEVE
jgi:multidrug efflux pump subunit AcrA (membrane-fusion protein)